ncbi:MAG: DUF58 domain-containing protein [Anaerolineales bacterium]
MDNPPPPTIRLRSRLWPALAILLFILQVLWPDKTWTALLGILGGGWLLAWLWVRSLARHLSIEREMRYGWTQVGDRLEERFTISNTGWAPAVWLEVRDHSNLPHYTASRVTGVGAEDITQWRSEGVCTRRGLYSLGPTSLLCGDPLGLYSLEMHLPDSAILLVLPPVLPLPAIEIASGGRAGEGSRYRRSALERTVSAQTVREYVEGDPLKAIHWPTSARRASLYVRQFEQMPSSDWWIFLDLQAAVQVGEGDLSTEEHGVVLAASLADRGLRQGHAVGLVTCGRQLTWIPPRRSPTQLMDILRALALASRGDRPLEDLLAQARKSIRSGASLVLITPSLQPGWLAPLLQLSRLGITPTVLLLDPASFGGEGNASGLAALFQEHGLSHTIVSADLLDQPEQRGREGEWEWRVVGPGKAVPVRRPLQVEWRRVQ